MASARVVTTLTSTPRIYAPPVPSTMNLAGTPRCICRSRGTRSSPRRDFFSMDYERVCAASCVARASAEELAKLAALLCGLDLPQGRGLDLPHALARQPHHATDLLQRVWHVSADPKAQTNDLLLAGVENLEGLLDLLLELSIHGPLERTGSVRVRDEAKQSGTILFRRIVLEGLGLLDYTQDLLDLQDRHAQLLCDLLGRRLAAQGLAQLPRHARDLLDLLVDVDRNPDDSGLVGDRSLDRLLDPPVGV